MPLPAARAFICYDRRHDGELGAYLDGQAGNGDSPFDVVASSADPQQQGWEEATREQVRACDVMLVLCGDHSDTSEAMAGELRMAQDEDIPYLLLIGRARSGGRRPTSARHDDPLVPWTWDSVKTFVQQVRVPTR
jgi:hypothetical protein